MFLIVGVDRVSAWAYKLEPKYLAQIGLHRLVGSSTDSGCSLLCLILQEKELGRLT